MKRNVVVPFSRYDRERKQKKEMNRASLSFIISGWIIAAVSLIRMIVSVGAREVLFGAAAAVGGLLILLGILFPRQMAVLQRKLSRPLNAVGVFFIRGLMVPIYLLTFVFTCLYFKNRRKDYRFERWEAAPPVRASYFEAAQSSRTRSGKSFSVISSIFSELSARKMYILLPLILVLLAVGLIFFFVSSSSVFSFIYTFL